MNTDLAVPVSPGIEEFELDQRRAKAYAESGYWPDSAKLAQALVKIEAGRSLGLPALVAMSEIHVIDGKPTLGAGALASLVKASRRYDYRVVKITADECVLRFYEHDEHVGDSVFVKADAEKAKLLGRGPWTQYPRNMLFARALSNGVAWYCPDVTMGRTYTGDEIEAASAPVEPPQGPSYANFVPGLPDEIVDDEIPFGDPLEAEQDALAAAEQYEREYLNDQEATVVTELEEDLDAKAE